MDLGAQLMLDTCSWDYAIQAYGRSLLRPFASWEHAIQTYGCS